MAEKQENAFIEYLDETFSQAINDALVDNRASSEEYKKAETEFHVTLAMLRDRLDDRDHVYRHFEAALHRTQALDLHSVYLQGFADCVLLLRRIRML